MLTESLLSVYKQAEGIKPEDYAAFAFYALVTMGGIHHHHMTEEETYRMSSIQLYLTILTAAHSTWPGT